MNVEPTLASVAFEERVVVRVEGMARRLLRRHTRVTRLTGFDQSSTPA
jgi:hypothetical protein